jgi:hypothetical protein
VGCTEGAALPAAPLTEGAALTGGPLTEGAALAVGRTPAVSSPPPHADRSNGTTTTAPTHRLPIIPAFYHDIDDRRCPYSDVVSLRRSAGQALTTPATDIVPFPQTQPLAIWSPPPRRRPRRIGHLHNTTNPIDLSTHAWRGRTSTPTIIRTCSRTSADPLTCEHVPG